TVSSQSASVSTAVIILVTCGCAAVVATLCLSLVCLCVRRCGSSGGGGVRGTTNHKSVGVDRDDQNNHLQRLQRKTSNSDAELHVHVVSHQSASIRRQRPQLPDQFVCSNSTNSAVAGGLVLTDRSSNQTQETCLDSGSFSCTNGSSASPVPQLQQPQVYSLGLQSQLVQHQLHQASYCSDDVTDSGCYFSTSVSPPPQTAPRRVIYEVVV
uniref:Secreted protein n=1 Tax=Macrostomum lignano TaxID=282301 RepID=A0A1I8IMN1_9PLAT